MISGCRMCVRMGKMGRRDGQRVRFYFDLEEDTATRPSANRDAPPVPDDGAAPQGQAMQMRGRLRNAQSPSKHGAGLSWWLLTALIGALGCRLRRGISS